MTIGTLLVLMVSLLLASDSSYFCFPSIESDINAAATGSTAAYRKGRVSPLMDYIPQYFR